MHGLLVGVSEASTNDGWTVRDTFTALAFGASLGALLLGFSNYIRARRLDKRDLFLRMHEALLDPSVVAGRRALYRLTDEHRISALEHDEETLTLVYRALATFDVLGLYAERGWIDENTVLDEWGNSLTRSIEPAQRFIAGRYKTIQWHSWPHYVALAEKARAKNESEGLT